MLSQIAAFGRGGSTVRRLILALVGLATLLWPSIARTQTPLERIARDDIVMVPDEDPAMTAAFRKAKATLPDFLTVLDKGNNAGTRPSVKIAVKEDSTVEYFWLSDFARTQDGKFSGRIDNTPRLVKNTSVGEAVVITENDIVDWLYFRGGRMIGNFTMCALLTREPPQEAEAVRRRFRLSCDP